MTIMSGTTINAVNRDDWLAERQNSIGASEAATVLGLNPWETSLSLYLKKIGALTPEPENLAMRLGHMLEPIVATLYREQTGCDLVAEQRFLRSPIYTWMSATLDYVRADGRPLEIKTVGSRSAHFWGEAGSDEVPPSCLVQVHHQMIVSGTETVDIASLIGGTDFRVYTIERDDDVANRIVEVTGDFMDRVRRRDPPRPDPDRDRRLMADLWPEAVGEMEFGPIGSALIEEWEYHRSEASSHEKAKDRCRTRILDMMEDRASATLHDGRLLTRKVVSVAEKTMTTPGYKYVDLRVKTPRGDR